VYTLVTCCLLRHLLRDGRLGLILDACGLSSLLQFMTASSAVVIFLYYTIVLRTHAVEAELELELDRRGIIMHSQHSRSPSVFFLLPGPRVGVHFTDGRRRPFSSPRCREKCRAADVCADDDDDMMLMCYFYLWNENDDRYFVRETP